MSGIATAVAGSAAVGGIASSRASSRAARAQQQATEAGIAEERRQFDLSREDLRPYREAGVAVLPQLTRGLEPGGDFNRDFTIADFRRDPGYEFRLSEGRRIAESGASAQGSLLSGATLRALTRYGQGVASEEFSNAYQRFNADRDRRFNRLSALAGTGQTATTDTAQLGANSASRISDLYTQGGNARAAGYIGQGNAINQGVQSLGNFYLQQQYLKRIPVTTPPTVPGP